MTKNYSYKGIEYYQEGNFYYVELDGKKHTYLSSHTVQLVIDKHFK